MPNSYPLGFGDPVGNALDAGVKGLQIGSAIADMPRQARNRQREEALSQYQFRDEQRRQTTEAANRKYNEVVTRMRAGEDVPVEEYMHASYSAGVPPSIGTPEMDQHIGSVISGMTGQTDYKSPEFAQAATQVYWPMVNHGVMNNPDLAQQSISHVVPAKGGALHVQLSNEKTDGTKYDAPLTLGRTGDDHDPVKRVDLEQGIHHTMAVAQLAQHFQDDPKLLQYAQKAAEIEKDPVRRRQILINALNAQVALSRGQKPPEAGDIVAGTDGKPMTSANGYFVYDKDLKPQHVETLHGAGQSRLAEAEEAVKQGYAKSVPEYLNMVNPKAGGSNFYTPPTPQAKRMLMKDDKGNYQWVNEGDDIPQGWQPASKTGAGGTGASLLNPDAIAVGAKVIRDTGSPPPGMSRNKADMAAMYNAAAQSAMTEGKTAEAEALMRTSNKASQSALTDITKRNTTLEANANNAENNFKTIEKLSTKVDRTNSPLLNRLKQAFQTEIVQDPDLKALKNAVSEGATEYAKVVTGQTTGAAVTDSANRQTAALLAASDSPAAFKAALVTMRELMANRRAGFATERQKLLQSLHPGAAGGAAQSEPGKQYTPQEAQALPPGTQFMGTDGVTRVRH